MININDVDTLLKMANSLHRNLEFTMELESEGALSFLDMKIVRHQDSLETKWFTKPTDTGLMLNFHSLAPTQYKRNVVEGTIHRINHTTTDWIAFHDGVAKAQLTFEQNGYPLNFMEILFGTLSTRFGMSQVQSTDRTQVRGKLWKRARNGARF